MRTELELWRLEREALERRAGSLSVEIHKKFSLPAACVVFVLIGAPLGMRVRRAGPAVAFVSVAFFLFYYLCLVGGEELANRLLLPPWLAMWLPNLVLGTWGVLATLRAIELWRPRAVRLPRWGRGRRAPGPRRPRGLPREDRPREDPRPLPAPGVRGLPRCSGSSASSPSSWSWTCSRRSTCSSTTTPPLPLIGRYYLYRLPEWLVQVLPIALLLATFLALGQLNKFGELTAMRTSGRSLFGILAPVLAVSVASTLLSLCLSEFVVPETNRQRDGIYDQEIQGMRHQEVTERADVTYLGEGGRIFYMRLYLVGEQRMHEVSLQEFQRRRPGAPHRRRRGQLGRRALGVLLGLPARVLGQPGAA